MKTIKKLTIIIATTLLIFTSCNNNKEKFNVELTDGTTIYYSLEDENAISIQGWNEFNTANTTLLGLEQKDYKIGMERLENLNLSIYNLENTIPESLKTEEVLEDIDDVKEEYKKLMKEKNEPQKNITQNIEELVEKFNDLREELNETVENYLS